MNSFLLFPNSSLLHHTNLCLPVDPLCLLLLWRKGWQQCEQMLSKWLSFATHISVNCWDVVHILKWFHLNIVASSRRLAPLHLLFLFHWKSHKPSQSTHVKVDFINKIGCFLSSFSFNIISNTWIIYDSLLITFTLLCCLWLKFTSFKIICK